MTTEPCARCGHEHPRCAAHAKSTGRPCMRWPRDGATVCPAHGGAARQVQQAAAERRAVQAAKAEAQGVLAHHGRPVEFDVLEEWLKLGNEIFAFKDALAQRVNALGQRIRYEATGAGTEQMRAELAAYERALDRTERFLTAYSKHNLDERRVALAEGQAQLVVGAISQILTAMLNSLVAALSEVQDAVDVIEQVWPELTAQHVPAVLRSLDTEGA